MAWTLPTGFASALEGKTPLTFAWVADLALAAGTEYYAEVDGITWGGNTYTKLITKVSPITEAMRIDQAPRWTVTFDNVKHTLRDNITSDLLTEKIITLRMLVQDQGGQWLAGSLAWKGFMQRPTRVDERHVEVQVLGLLHGTQSMMPGARRFGRQCEWDYANGGAFDGGGDCAYQQTTTANGAGASTTALVVNDGTNLQDGESITIGSGAAVTISSGGGTVNITLAEARSWSDTDSVKLVNCTHEFPNCQKRVMTHRYGGFRGSEYSSDISETYFLSVWKKRQDISGSFLKNVISSGMAEFQAKFFAPADVPETQPAAELEKTVPVGFGRRLISGKVADVSGLIYTGDTVSFLAAVHILGVGEISSIVDFYIDDARGAAKYNATGNSLLSFGYYYRVGGTGLDASETEADYISDPSTLARDQNRDFYSGVRDPYHAAAYATFVQILDDPETPSIEAPLFDVKLLLVQKYDTGGSADGSPVWSRNPIWQMSEAIRQEWGMGKHLSASDVDYSVTEPSADVCDVTVYGEYVDVVDTTNDTGSYDLWEVDDTAQFTRGMTVEVDENGTPTDATVTNVWSATTMRLSYAKQNPTAPAKIRPKIPRYACDLYLESSRRFSRSIADIARTCNAYATYDVDGKIQLRIEAASPGSVATFADVDAADGYQILDFEWLPTSDGVGFGGGYANRVVAKYVTQENVTREAVANDFDHRIAHSARQKTLDLAGVDNAHQSYRLAKLELDKSRVLNTGAVITVGPIGAKVQCGDTVSVTHEVPDWSAKELRVVQRQIMSAGDNQDGLVKLYLADYDSTIYVDTANPAVIDDTTAEDAPTLTLTATATSGGLVDLSWVWGAGSPTQSQLFKVYKHSATMAGDPQGVGTLIAIKFFKSNHQYSASSAELGTTLYFVVTAKVGKWQNKQRVQSAEVTAVPMALDPTDTEEEQGINTVYDGGFQVPHQWDQDPEPTTAEVKPDAGAGDYTNQANAYDSDNATAATGTAVFSGDATKQVTYTLPGTAAGISGYWVVRHNEDSKTQTNKGGQVLTWSNDGGSTSNYFTTSYAGVQTSQSVVIEGDRDNTSGNEVQLIATTNATAGTFNGRVYEVTWVEAGSTNNAGGRVSGGEAEVWGDTTETNYGSVRRPWPGQAGDPDKTVANGSNWVVTVKFKSNTPTQSLDVFLYDVNADTYYTLTTVATSTAAATYKEQAQLWTAPSTLTGPFEVGIRTQSAYDGRWTVTEFQISAGQQIYQYTPHPNEPKKDPKSVAGTPDGYTRGPWDGNPKTTTVST